MGLGLAVAPGRRAGEPGADRTLLRLLDVEALAGGQTLAAGQEITQIEGAPPKRRVVIAKWNSLEQLQAWRNSEQYKEDRKIGDKYATTIRAFAVEGLPQN